MGEVSVKAYLLKDDGQNEVRRFSIDQNVATSFIYLKEKLKSTFPYLNASDAFEIFWKDTEGDNVTIGSDEELTIALTDNRNEDLFKIYVEKNNGGPTNNNSNPSGLIHEGVVCDECNSPIHGFRYKCLGCRNFDLCSNCETRGLHSEHLTLRIPTPLNTRGHFGHRLFNKLSKATRKAEARCPWSHQRNENNNNNNNNFCYENLAEHFTNNCSTEESPKANRKSKKHSKSYENFKNYGSCADSNECGKGCSASSEIGGNGARASAVLNLDPNAILNNLEPVLNNLDPNNILNTLSNFGLDLSGFFPPQAGASPTGASGAGAATSNTNDNTNKETQTNKKTQNEKNDESSAPKIPKMTPNTFASTSSQAGSSATQTGASAVQTGGTATQTHTSTTTSGGTTTTTTATDTKIVDIANDTNYSLLDGWTVYNPNAPGSHDNSPAREQSAEPIEIDLSSEIGSQRNSISSEKNSAPQASTSTTKNIYPSLSGLPKNKKVAEALDEMIAMGFNDENGWLTNLLNLQNGNISTVIDFISAMEKK